MNLTKRIRVTLQLEDTKFSSEADCHIFYKNLIGFSTQVGFIPKVFAEIKAGVSFSSNLGTLEWLSH